MRLCDTRLDDILPLRQEDRRDPNEQAGHVQPGNQPDPDQVRFSFHRNVGRVHVTLQKAHREIGKGKRTAMRIAIMRLIRDFEDVATDCRAFLERSMEAAASWQKYWAQTCKDLTNDLSAREEENAHHCADLLVYREEFDAK